MELKFVKAISMYYEAAEFLSKMMSVGLAELNSLLENYNAPDKELLEAKLEDMHYKASTASAAASSFLLDAMELYARLLKQEVDEHVGTEEAQTAA